LYLLSYGIIVFALFLVFGPNVLNHPDNYNQADPMQTPPHIVPEWYFLPFYAILRAIPNKTMGVVAMAVSILIFMVLPSKRKLTKPKYSNNLQLLEKSVFWAFFVNSIFLGYLGGMPIEWPYNVFSLIFCGAYFILVLLLSADLEQYALRGNENFEMYMLRQTKRAYDCYSENIPSLVFDLYFIVVALVSVNLG
jgi:ubiquinol-cytochrome c reductase cytochrome b subunit